MASVVLFTSTLANLPILEEHLDTERVADELVSRSLIPVAARLDALHVATAALAGVQYLLTLNCRHIANAHVLPGVYRLLDDLGLPGMLITTPTEFLGGTSDGESNSQRDQRLRLKVDVGFANLDVLHQALEESVDAKVAFCQSVLQTMPSLVDNVAKRLLAECRLNAAFNVHLSNLITYKTIREEFRLGLRGDERMCALSAAYRRRRHATQIVSHFVGQASSEDWRTLRRMKTTPKHV